LNLAEDLGGTMGGLAGPGPMSYWDSGLCVDWGITGGSYNDTARGWTNPLSGESVVPEKGHRGTAAAGRESAGAGGIV